MFARENHLLSLLDWTTERIEKTLELAASFKSRRRQGESDCLSGKSIAMFFEKPSLRTITTFQVGIYELGANSILLDPNSIGLGKRESIADVARCLARWTDGMVVRCFQQELIEELARWGDFPVINALTDDYHPCQALAFAQTMQDHFGELKNKRVVFVGDGNNVANSLTILAAKTGMHFTLCCPKGFEQPQELIKTLEPDFKLHGGSYRLNYEPGAAVKDADILYSDVWVSMGQEEQKDSKANHFLPYQINKELMALAPSHCQVTHCLPAHRGEEITDSIMESTRNLCFDEAENRLHAQKAVMADLFS